VRACVYVCVCRVLVPVVTSPAPSDRVSRSEADVEVEHCSTSNGEESGWTLGASEAVCTCSPATSTSSMMRRSDLALAW
jgi:hypothetical protein